jgi:hypothetical protein
VPMDPGEVGRRAEAMVGGLEKSVC